MRLRSVFHLSACWVVFAAVLLASPGAHGDVPQDKLLEAFKNIRSDDIPNNAGIACAWLYSHRNELTSEFLDEMYRTDAQGRDVIMYCLMRTKSYNPDPRFCQTLVSRLNDEDHVVKDAMSLRLQVHWLAWTYMDRRYDLFKELLLANLSTTDDMLTIWGTVTLLQKHGDLDALTPKMSPHVWDTAALSLHTDGISYNASQAVRFYFLMGQTSLSHLEPLVKSDDQQTRTLSAATIDAIGGSKKAYAYLCLSVDVGTYLFDPHQANPNAKSTPWLTDEMDKVSKETPPPYQ